MTFYWRYWNILRDLVYRNWHFFIYSWHSSFIIFIFIFIRLLYSGLGILDVFNIIRYELWGRKSILSGRKIQLWVMICELWVMRSHVKMFRCKLSTELDLITFLKMPSSGYIEIFCFVIVFFSVSHTTDAHSSSSLFSPSTQYTQ